MIVSETRDDPTDLCAFLVASGVRNLGVCVNVCECVCVYDNLSVGLSDEGILHVVSKVSIAQCLKYYPIHHIQYANRT